MTGQVHGHQVMKMIHEADPPLSREGLRQAVRDRYGDEVRFCACVAEGMSLEQLLSFLVSRGKVVEVDRVLRTDIGLMCEHG
jgi:probable metal-binding protein